MVIGTDCIGSNKSNSIGVETKSSALVIFTFERETRQNITVNFFFFCYVPIFVRGRCGRDRMEIRFTTTYVISAYHY